MIGKKIKMIRMVENLTQVALGDKLGIPVKTIKNYETEITKVSSDFLFRLCEAFPEYAYWLMTGRTDAEAGHISPELKLSQEVKI